MEFKKFISSIRRKTVSVGNRIGQVFRFKKGNILDQLFRVTIIFLGFAVIVGWVTTRYILPTNSQIPLTHNQVTDFSEQDLGRAVRSELETLLATEYSWLIEPVAPVTLGVEVDPFESLEMRPDPHIYREDFDEEDVEEVLAISFDRILWPVKGEIATHYGWYRHHISKDWRFNPGLAFDTEKEEQIRTVLDGRIKSIEPGIDGFKLVIDHGSDWQSIYQGIRSIAVNIGDIVTQNQTVANSGNNGEMFFALHYHGEPVDPLQYMVTY